MPALDPAALELRPLGTPDAAALADLYAACEQIDRTGEHYSVADLLEEMANPDLDLGKDMRGAFEAGGRLAGAWSVMLRNGTPRKLYAMGMTRPDLRGQGVGGLLAEGMFGRVREIRDQLAEPLLVISDGVTENDAQADLLARHGLQTARWSFAMRVRLGSAPPAAPVLDGYVVRVYDEASALPLLAAHNAAFLDHPNFSTWTESEWRHWVTDSRNFRGELTFLATPVDRPEEIAAYLQTSEFEAHREATGRREAYVAKLGTLPAHRGRGLAGSLLAHALAAYQQGGYDEAALDVDSQNPTGALGIYERAGFVVERRFTQYAATLG